jgi:hypothetical protein
VLHSSQDSAQASLRREIKGLLVAVARALIGGAGGSRRAASVSWQFEDLSSQLWSSVNLFHGLSMQQKSEVKKALTQARKRHFLSHLYIKCIILPRQARDKHRENSKKVPFSLSDASHRVGAHLNWTAHTHTRSTRSTQHAIRNC